MPVLDPAYFTAIGIDEITSLWPEPFDYIKTGEHYAMAVFNRLAKVMIIDGIFGFHDIHNMLLVSDYSEI
jgi:hypothetical protein